MIPGTTTGWLATTLHPPLWGWGHFDHDVWELYHLASDRTQSRNVATEHPDLLERLKGLWFYYAGVYRGLPLDDRNALDIGRSERPRPGVSRDRYVYSTRTSAVVSKASAVSLVRRSFGIAAGVDIETPDAEGVLLAYSGVGGGLALYLQDNRVHFVYNWLGKRIQMVTSDVEITTGHVLAAAFEKTGDDPTGSAVGTMSLYVDTALTGSLEILTQPAVFGFADGVSVGRNSGSPVSPDYRPPFAFTGGTIDRVLIDVTGKEFVDYEKEVLACIARD